MIVGINTYEMSALRKNVYGNDMLYVAAPDGTKVGRVNLETGRVTMDRADLRAEFDRPRLPHRSFTPELVRETKGKAF